MKVVKARVKGYEDVEDVAYDPRYNIWYIVGTSHVFSQDELEFLPEEEVKEEVKDLIEENDNIDWEHRRYEVAKEAMLRMIDPNVLTQKYCVMAVNAVEFANALIEELKEARRPK